MPTIPCSVPILTLNALEGLQRLLPLLKDRFDDVFIVDGNSTDGTTAYAQSLGIRVEKQFMDNVPNHRITDFSVARERSWNLARHGWIFWLDADEVPAPELLDRVTEIVTNDKSAAVHRFVRIPQLPDGRVVQYGFYFPERIIRLFHRSSGISLVDRPVHEKFIVPSGVHQVDHDERILAPWPSPLIMWSRQRRYLELDNGSTVPTWLFLLRWIWWYNLKSLCGQFLRALRSSWRGWRSGGLALPWGYNILFLKYRVLRMIRGTGDWMQKRYRTPIA